MAAMATALDRRVDGVRRFNRFYTQRIGVLAETLLNSPFTLAEGRVLYDLAQRAATSPTELAANLDLDPGYLSRILQRFERQGLVTRTASPTDGRRAVLGTPRSHH
jgi:DNA-binding MarR family transcriptional regulator